MFSEEFIEAFSKSLELKKRQLDNYEELIKGGVAKDLLGTVVAEEGAQLEKMNRVVSEIFKDMEADSAQTENLKSELTQALSELESVWSRLEGE